tara:strand:+ start:66 stop:1286 length:1221 start_codon:yes stop_codon:yes gene_type:complete
MSVTRTFTVTVQSTDSGNKYLIDGVQQATINIAENGTYKFDQSDNTNNGHPLKFSTTSGGTHSGGSEYTTGVTYNGTPGQAGAYTQITVAESAPTLYYYCQYHSGMGGQANTVDDNTYGMWAWGTNEWGDQGPIEITLTAPAVATSSVGSVIASQEVTVSITAPSTLTSSFGSISLDLTSVIPLTAPSQMTSQLGSFDNAGTLVGWGRNGWGEEPYGDSFNKLEQLSGLSVTSSVGSVIAAVGVSLTGISSTSSVGALSPADVMGLTGVSSTTSVGSVIIGEGVPLTAPAVATASVGAILPADVVGLTGLSTTSGVGSLVIANEEIVIPTGQSITSSVGSLVIEIGVPLTGVSATTSVGAISPADVVALTGFEVTSEVGTTGFGTLAYKDIDITGNTSYTDVTHAA